MSSCPECGASMLTGADWCRACGASAISRVGEGGVVGDRSQGGRGYSADDLRRPWRMWARLVWVSAIALLGAGVWGVGFGLAALFGDVTFSDSLRESGTILAMLFVGAVAGIAALVAWHVFLFRVWDVAQSFSERTTPAKAVGFLFVPLFNLYWVHVAYHGLAQDMNRQLRLVGLGERLEVSEALVVTAHVLLIVGVLSWLTVITWVVSVGSLMAFSVCGLILAGRFKAAAIAIADGGR